MFPQTIRNDLEPSRIMRAQGFDYDHEIQVALPPSYDTDPDATYPVLWLTDGREYLSATATLVRQYAMARLIPELIVVSVGPPSDLNDVVEIQRRRTFDFSPKEDVLYDGLGGQKMRQMMAAMGDAVPTMPGGGAPGFLDFLVDEVRPALAADYRMDPDDQALFGHSGGGMFVGYALFARPGSFSKFICGSPSLNTGNYAIFDMEEAYAAAHDDFDAQIFFGAGELEIDNPMTAMWSLVGSLIRMSETLRLRGYPSLKITTRIFEGEDHLTVIWPLLSAAVRALWADKAPPPFAMPVPA